MDRIKPSGRLTTISFFGTVPASSQLTLVSKKIDVPFITRLIRQSFAPGVNRTALSRVFISPDDSAPTTEYPTGINVLAQTGQADYITGDDEFKEFAQETEIAEANKYIKIHVTNGDTFPHTVDAQVTLELLPR